MTVKTIKTLNKWGGILKKWENKTHTHKHKHSFMTKWKKKLMKLCTICSTKCVLQNLFILLSFQTWIVERTF